MEAISLHLLFGFSVFVGVLIGCVGIGGVLLVPFLTYILGFGIHMSIAAAMFGYIFVGIVGAIVYARHGSIEWSKAIWMVRPLRLEFDQAAFNWCSLGPAISRVQSNW